MKTIIEFIDYHMPGTLSGDYKVMVEQTVEGSGKITTENFFTANHFFTVQGARFSLAPENIYATFPPQGNQGDHSHTLPHISFTRSTIPWERSGHNDKGGYPWLALLLFNDEENPTPLKVSLKELEPLSKGNFFFPGLDLETGQNSEDTATVIDVKQSLLQALLPDLADLKLSAHVRLNIEGDSEEEVAILLSPCLPLPGASTTVHLVSIEERYNDNGFDFQGAEPKDLIRLVTLKSWTFSSLNESKAFKGILKGLNISPSTLRLPAVENSLAEESLGRGSIPLAYHLRGGGKSFAWYHGPFITGDSASGMLAEKGILLPARGPDELLRYQKKSGLFDASYGAAWQLGRLLALADKNFSIPLYNWKQGMRRKIKEGEDYSHILTNRECDSSAGNILPDSLREWMINLALLKGVPFNYLVADERILPLESLRFFHVDSGWIACLLDGAFSMGRALPSDFEIDRDSLVDSIPQLPPKVSGFLMRSEVVSGWPELLVKGYGEIIEGDDLPSLQPLTLFRMERLSNNVLLLLFEGEVQTVDISEKPQSLHFGFSTSSEEAYYKELRNENGSESEYEINPIPYGNKEKRRVSLKGLADGIAKSFDWKNCPSSRFALQMVEGVEGVRFKKEARK